jgi:hypothetical protein
MKNVELTLPTLGFVVGTRAALAFGLGLLLADHIPPGKRRSLAITLIAIGAATTVPAARMVLGSRAARTDARALPPA